MKKLLLFAFLCISNALFAQTLSFPGAEGFGRFATGGRGGDVYIVTNLNDSGSGSLRDAVSQPNRIVVFEVGGIINIDTRIVVSQNITIAGQTAPGDGIVVYGNGMSYSNASNTITRYLRVRMGVNGDSGKDALGIANGINMIFDHLSVSWGRDENFSINWDSKNSEPGNITIQHSIIGQGLWSHSCGGLIQTNGGVSLYRNLYIDNKTRNPKVKGKNEFVNNIVYNWGDGGAYILGDSEGASAANIINNFFIAGPAVNNHTAPFIRGNLNFSTYGAGNYYDSIQDGTLSGRLLEQFDYGVGDRAVNWMTVPFAYPIQPDSGNVVSAQQAYSIVLQGAGANIPKRDQVDSIMISELASLGTCGITITTFTNENLLPTGGPGVVNGGVVQTDTDRDGIPDVWEVRYGLNPDSAADGKTLNTDGYTNLEHYINCLADASLLRNIKVPNDGEKAFIRVFPNPAASSVTVRVGANAPFLVEVVNMNGKVLKSTNSTGPIFNISTAELPSGNYLLRVISMSGKNTQIRKIVVVH
ncbi:T9SS type A sorting domain-containing protein [Chitinophaga sp. LS1]|uniref:T9SS type A sorting domain-containing protein n=1 Tax=Chitinophaga sp. LS1 TaxID=3051176 RepID=UPI002AAB1B6F|nr:T9SS type A sorting domain-containing protein [Chitinophaga sp. LS1]WPV65303.1 T9SS type A sorting domain-containing protein [Chitinophaga sp. LS1]